MSTSISHFILYQIIFSPFYVSYNYKCRYFQFKLPNYLNYLSMFYISNASIFVIELSNRSSVNLRGLGTRILSFN